MTTSEHQKPVLTSNGEIATIPANPPFDPRKALAKAKNIALTVITYWWLIIICAVIGGLLGWLYDETNQTPPQHTAHLVFNLETGSGSSEMSAFASALGVPSAGANNNMFSGENFRYLFRSKKIGTRVMLTPVTIGGKTDLLINFYKNRSGILRKEDSEMMQDYFRKLHFPNVPLDKYSILQRSYVDKFRESAAGDLKIDNVDRKASFMELSFESDSDTLSQLIVQTFLNKMVEFYQESKSQKTLELLKLNIARRDSISNKLSGAERRLAATQDISQYAIMPSARVNEGRMQQNTAFLQSLYSESIRNIDALRTSLIRESPLITIIDEPDFPLPFKPYPYGKMIKVGIALGVIVSLLLVFLISAYKNMLQKASAS
ncbi:MAG: hypothetical protein QM669_07280 [Siphonobacter sp.]